MHTVSGGRHGGLGVRCRLWKERRPPKKLEENSGILCWVYLQVPSLCQALVTSRGRRAEVMGGRVMVSCGIGGDKAKKGVGSLLSRGQVLLDLFIECLWALLV